MFSLVTFDLWDILYKLPNESVTFVEQLSFCK